MKPNGEAIKGEGFSAFCRPDTAGLIKTIISVYSPPNPILNEGTNLDFQNTMYGLLNANGKEVLKPIFQKIQPIVSGIIVVQNEKRNWATFDKMGQELGNNLIYDEVVGITNKFFLIQDLDKRGVISAQDTRYLKPVFDDIQWDGKYFTCKVSRGWFKVKINQDSRYTVEYIEGDKKLFDELVHF